MSFVLAFLVVVGMHLAPKPQTKIQSALGITVVLGAISVMMAHAFVWMQWIDWSYWVAVIAVWIWSIVILMVSKPGEPCPDPFAIFRRHNFHPEEE